MGHDSGFRRGGQDFTHRPKAKSNPRRDSRRFDKQTDQRFKDHTRKTTDKP